MKIFHNVPSGQAHSGNIAWEHFEEISKGVGDIS
jgi:hypothetical protein